jgi:hypothetical protein
MPDSLPALPQAPASTLHRWAQVWFVWNAAAFLQAYFAAVQESGMLPADASARDLLLRAFLFERALRPLTLLPQLPEPWLHGALEGVLQLLSTRTA